MKELTGVRRQLGTPARTKQMLKGFLFYFVWLVFVLFRNLKKGLKKRKDDDDDDDDDDSGGGGGGGKI